MKTQKFELRRLTFDDEAAFKKAVAEWDSSPQFIFAQRYDPQVEFYKYVDLLKDQENGEDLPTGYVPSTTLFAFLGKEIVGRVSIRHYLNDFLKSHGGHIGYGVIPRFRRQGFAKKMLEASIPFMKELNVDRVLVTCDDNNPGSIKTIEANGGVLENKISQGEDRPLKRRYWIDIS